MNLSEDAVVSRLHEDLQDLLVTESLGIEASAAKLHRYIPAEIYVPGDGDATDLVFLDLVMAVITLSGRIGWQIHNAGPVQYSSRRVALILQTPRLERRELQEDLEAFGEALTDAFEKAKDKALERKKTEAEIKKITAETGLARAKKWGIYAAAVSALVTAFTSTITPGTYVQIGTTRIEMKSDGPTIERVPASAAIATVHFSPKTADSSEKGKKE